MKKHVVVPAIAFVVASMGCALAAQITAVKPPSTKMTASGPQAHQPPGGRQPVNQNPRATVPSTAPTRVAINTGTVYGFVYWDASIFSHIPASSCSGLAITVSVGTPTGPFTSYTPMSPISSFKYIGTAHTSLTSVTATSYGVCAYSYPHVPVGPNLQVSLSAPPGTFTPFATPKYGSIGPIQINNSQCSKLPPLTKATVADLSGNWGTCQNVAYDVNFLLVKGSKLMSQTSSGGSGSGGSGGTLLGTSNGATSPGRFNSPSRGLLTGGVNPGPIGSPSPAMLPGAAGATPAGGANRSAMPNKKSHGTALKAVKLPAPVALRKMTNPRLAQQNASIIAVLEQQRQAAQQESTIMKSALRSAATARTTALAANLQGNAPATGITPGHTQSTHGNASSLGVLPFFNSLPATCSYDPTPRVLRVNGGQAPGIFTPEAKYNQYTITGCGFGQAQGSAHIFGSGGFTANLYIDYWSDNGITAHFDPALAGVLDQNNVTLVIVPPGLQQIQKSGFKFYAARGMPNPGGSDQEVALAYDSIPQSSVRLQNSSPMLAGYNQLPWNAQSQFPSFSFQGTPVGAWVFRYVYSHQDGDVTDCYINDVHYDDANNKTGFCRTFVYLGSGGGTDMWDLSRMTRGFVISSYELYYENTDPSTLCGAWDDVLKHSRQEGQWDFSLTAQSQIAVTWTTYYCGDGEMSQRHSGQQQSAYGLAAWVMGPRCVDPWTGQKDQNCMAQVKQILG